MKTILFVALLIPISTSCVSPAAPSESSGSSNGVTIVALSPSTANVGARVIIQGSGFTAASNTVTVAAVTVDGDTPNEPGVIPGLSSADGITVVFEVPVLWRPACSFSSAPCPFARIATAPGTYRVSVTNATGTSNAMLLLVTR